MNRGWMLGFALASLTGLVVFGGCGSDGSAMISEADGGSEGGDEGTNGDASDAANDGANGGEGGVMCASYGKPCLASADCCSNECDLTAHTCAAPQCKNATDPCASPTECCSFACVGGACATACIPSGNNCGTGAECCSGNCTGGTCQAVVTTCGKTLGETCSVPGDCCSKYCAGGLCAQTLCGQPGDICATATDCCGRVCNITGGASLGTCSSSTGGGGTCTGRAVDGIACAGATDCNSCCSRLCAPFKATGVFICQPTTGCKAIGELCASTGDCCGAGATTGPSVCDITPPYTLGTCSNGQACKEDGDVCHYKGNTSYACVVSTTANDCCSKNCELDVLGIPRCGAKNCIATGLSCAFTGECCDGKPCVPAGPGGSLICGTTACIPVAGPCTIDADCCVGTTCVVPSGSTKGTCNPFVPPVTDAGASDGGGSDGGTCSLYGQTCNAPSDCCNPGSVTCINGRCLVP